MTETLSWPSSCLVFSANRGQLDAGSTTTGSSFLPSTPPFALISSMAIRTVSFRTVSEIAIVPDRLCSTPTLMVPPDWAKAGRVTVPARATAAVNALRVNRLCIACALQEKGWGLGETCPPVAADFRWDVSTLGLSFVHGHTPHGVQR